MVSVLLVVVARHDGTPSERTPRSGKPDTSRRTQPNARCRMRLRTEGSRGTRAAS